ncbi:uncharacterized protein TrAFT101_011176 [Trichoderma asperellum]|uniref:uncharacterized protein n=1 Tax=Trichoderma asperellum TaxID=101201 RepID=UPI00332FD94F|nr:hypothetical protein TrAFT101_011176 [Trichoderma asperellum]
MAPIRICIIGLAATSSAGYKTGEWGIQHLNSLKSSPHYQIVGICNSSLASAQKSIESHKLGSDVKAYSSVDEVASDPDVDMVSIVVAIGKHYQLMKPLLQHKKDILVEFPIAPTVAEVEELAALAKSAGVKALSGSQGRAHPVFRHMKDLIKSGAIGDVVVSTLNGHNALMAAPMWPESQSILLNIDSGISRLHLIVGHILDTHLSILGDFKDIQSTFKTQNNKTKIVDDKGNTVQEIYDITAPDTMLFQGVLESGALASVTMRTSTDTVDNTGFRWIISGTKGELALTSEPGIFHWGPTGLKLKLREFGGEAKEIDFNAGEGELLKQVSYSGQNVARVYEAFAKGKEDGYATLDDALKVHRALEKAKVHAVWA